ncbi:BrnT family toxin [uncultured Thiocystis sp.]|jgi:uncharacterized DUF497 family protein|uniref:BrnT family toxin n=1 Tax=uncultured Thiocystis sp. TaxID=1202134 RepID=UPI0025EC8B9A|nr:BrnT family toxin [uncultured Thiocystis sp.]
MQRETADVSLIFEWDQHKDIRNASKHGLAFTDVTVVFDDPLARIFPDIWHSQGERREIMIGHLTDRKLCLVVFTEVDDNRIRIISARLATPKEQRDYERNAR